MRKKEMIVQIGGASDYVQKDDQKYGKEQIQSRFNNNNNQ